MFRFVAAAAPVVALTLALALLAPAAAQQSGVRTSALDCIGDPESVVIENAGDAEQDLNGWSLQSDPDETFDLSGVGSLQPAATVTIQSGPSAAGAFTWSTEEVFRDDDDTDYVRLVDDTGATIDEVACSPSETPEPTATPTPEATQGASPDGVPNGGGPPPPTGAGLSPALLLAVGLVTAGAGALAVGLARRP
jgi:hypothetical protein